VARVGEKRGVFGVLVGKTEGKETIEFHFKTNLQDRECDLD